MANTINWGKIYESTYWGNTDNNISWGKAYADLAGVVPALVSEFVSRVEADGGSVESTECMSTDLTFLVNNPEPSAFDADYQAILDRSTTLGYTAPSATQQTLQNTLVEDLKTAGVWDKLDVFYCFATDGDSDFATLNWKAPSSFQATKTNSPTFTANEGFAQSGTASLDTGFVLDTHGTNYTQNNAGVFVAFPTLSSTSLVNNRPFGTDVENNYLSSRIDIDGVNNINRIWLNSTSQRLANYLIYKQDDTIHFYNRTSSTSVNQRNTDLVGENTSTLSGNVPSEPLIGNELILLRFFTGLFEQTAKMGIFALGSSLTTAEMQDVEEAWYTNYFTSL
jgi:hypothetical protein